MLLKALGFGKGNGGCASVGVIVCASYGYSWTDKKGGSHSV